MNVVIDERTEGTKRTQEKARNPALLQDAESYQQLLDRLELLETVAGIRTSLNEFEQGQGVAVNQVGGNEP